MADHVIRAVDPEGREWWQALDGLCRRARQDRWSRHDALMEHVAARPEGGLYLHDRDGGPGLDPAPLGVAWWRDAVGRLHWYAEVGARELRDAFLAPLLPGRHPLEWIAPPLSGGWRERGGKAEFVVACRCGVAGTPAGVAWMGATCGPCHDADQEGYPPVGPEVFRPGPAVVRLVPMACGRLVVVRASEPRLACYTPPYAEPPVWVRGGPEDPLVAAGQDRIAVGSADGSVTLLDAADGRTRQRFAAADGGLVGLAFAGPGRQTLVTLHLIRVRFWEAGATAPRAVSALRDPASGDLTATPDGSRVAAFTMGGVDVFDVATGRPVERLDAHPEYGAGRGVWCDDGAFVGACVPLLGATGGLCRWGRPGSIGLLARLLGRDSRRPDLTADGYYRYVAADGRHLLTGRGPGLMLHDVATLNRVATFTAGGRVDLTHFAFGPGGQLFVGTRGGFAVWPWRELFGVRS